MDWFINLGYVGLFLGALLAGTVFPLSTDVLFIGVLLAGGDPVISLICATAGNWLGAMTSYGLGWLGKWEWLERWFKVKKETLEKQKGKIDKYGLWLAFFSWAPVVGTVSVITLGFYKVKPRMVTVLVLLGCFVRFLFWTILFNIYGGQVMEWIQG